jgi:hypothetical protein
VEHSNDVSVITHTWLIKRLQQAIEIAIHFDLKGADIIRWTDERERMIKAFHNQLVINDEIPYAADVFLQTETVSKVKVKQRNSLRLMLDFLSLTMQRNCFPHFLLRP